MTMVTAANLMECAYPEGIEAAERAGRAPLKLEDVQALVDAAAGEREAAGAPLEAWVGGAEWAEFAGRLMQRAAWRDAAQLLDRAARDVAA